jgi:hypothetical protein
MVRPISCLVGTEGRTPHSDRVFKYALVIGASLSKRTCFSIWQWDLGGENMPCGQARFLRGGNVTPGIWPVRSMAKPMVQARFTYQWEVRGARKEDIKKKKQNKRQSKASSLRY